MGLIRYPAAMRAVVIQKQGSPVAPNVEYRTDWPEPPAPGPGEAQVVTLASAFNHMDLWVGMGIPGVDLTYPRISGCDACGVIEAVGPGVDPGWVGKRVIVNAAVGVKARTHPDDPAGATLAPQYELIGEHRNGMFAERFLAPADNLAAVADDEDPFAAAAFGLTALTAYSMIVTKACLSAGATVLITGIGGGVATAALAIVKHLGCAAIVTSRHQWKLDRARDLGADHAVLDAGGDWSREVRALTRKRGVDLCIDSTGKATHLNCIKSLARGGTYCTPGATTGGDATTDLTRIFWNQLRLLGSTMGTNDEFREVVALFNRNKVRPAIDQVIDAADARNAYARIESGEQFGKVVLRW